MRSVLQRLRQTGLVTPLSRRVGGIHAGSEGTIYRLTGRGLGILRRTDGIQRRRMSGEPGERFVRHVLAISELYVSLSEQTQSSDDEIVAFDAEPASWRSYPSPHGGLSTIRPDAFARTASGDYEHISFVEVDLSTESLTTIGRKCRAYIAFWQTGAEQRRSGTFPRVVWVVPDEHRRAKLMSLIRRMPADHGQLFVVTTPPRAAAVLLGHDEALGGQEP
jgi:hypothetical protein